MSIHRNTYSLHPVFTVVALLFSMMLVTSCASQTQQSQAANTAVQTPLTEQQFSTTSKSLQSISGKGKLSSEIGSTAITLSFDVDVLGNDSLLMSFQTFGLPLGTLQATPNYFVFYSILENRIYRGKPTRENLSRTIRVPLSYDEMSTLFLGNIPGGEENFTFYDVSVDTENESTTLLYVRSDEEFVERVGLSEDGARLVEYSRKVPAGSTLMVSRFSNFETNKGHDLANRIAASFPAYDAAVTIAFEELTCNERADKYWFAVPKDAEVFELR